MAKSLKENFKEANHIRHTLMDIAMLTMVAGTVASMAMTGIPIGLADPVGMFASMHIPAMENIGAIGDAFGALGDAFANSTWATGAFFADPHALMGHAAMGHGAAAAAAEPVLSEAGMQLLGAG